MVNKSKSYFLFQSGDVGILDLHTVRVNPDGTPGEKILSCCEEGETTGFILSFHYCPVK